MKEDISVKLLLNFYLYFYEKNCLERNFYHRIKQRVKYLFYMYIKDKF